MSQNGIITELSKTTMRHEGGLAIKIYDGQFSKSEVLTEALNQARVEETGINVAHLREIRSEDGKWVIICDFIEGTILSRLMKNNPDKFTEYLELFVDLQLDVHHHSCPALGKLRDDISRKINHSGLDAATRFELHNRLDSMPKHNKLCHGSYTPDNVMLGNDGKNYIFSWGQATQGNASADAAHTYLHFWLSGDVDIAEEYMQIFCRKSDTARQYVHNWLPIVAASQSVTCAPEDRDKLLHWVKLGDFD